MGLRAKPSSNLEHAKAVTAEGRAAFLFDMDARRGRRVSRYTQGMPAIDLANQITLAVGLLLLAVGGVRVLRQRQWSDAITLPPCDLEGLQGLDAALVAWLFMFLPTVVVSVLGSLDVTALTGDVPEAQRKAVVSALAIAISGTINLCAIIFIGRAKIKGGLRSWGLTGQPLVRQAGWALLIVFMICPLLFGLMYLVIMVYGLVSGTQLPEHEALTILRAPSTPMWLIVMTVVNAVVIAPLVEELVLRGVLLPVVAKGLRSSWQGIVVTALLFGMIHYSVPQTVPSLTLFGIILGYAYAKSGSLVLPILIHAIFNLRTVLFTLLGAGEM